MALLIDRRLARPHHHAGVAASAAALSIGADAR